MHSDETKGLNLFDKFQYWCISRKIKKARKKGKTYLRPVYNLRHNVHVRLVEEEFQVKIAGTFKDQYSSIEWF